jgi:hypothetical protein
MRPPGATWSCRPPLPPGPVGAENSVIATDLVFRVVRGPSKLDIWLRDFDGIRHC